MKILVGSTGFVGSNLIHQARFDGVYHSTDITEAYGTSPELLVYAGVRAQKYIANTAPGQDLAHIEEAVENIRRIAPRKLVLISTVDVFREPVSVDEDSPVLTGGLHAYGRNRYQLESWVRENCPGAMIVRLPALFGRCLRKNFIYDMIRIVPSMLKAELYEKLAAQDPVIREHFVPAANGFYRLDAKDSELPELKDRFRGAGFTAMKFTDSRSVFQFYPLYRLWEDILTADEAGLTLWHAATEPVSAGEICEYLTGERFTNELPGTPADYGYRTRYSGVFGGTDGYILTREEVLSQLKDFYARNTAAAGGEII